MSWSLSYSGHYHPILSDTYHRVAIKFNFNDILSESFSEYLKRIAFANISHLVITIDDSYEKINENDFLKARKILDSLKNCTSTANIAITMFVESTNTHTYKLITSLQPKICILPYYVDRFTSKQFFEDILEKMDEKVSDGIIFGIHSLPDFDLQNCIELFNIPSQKIKVLDIGKLELPNLKLRTVDYANAHGIDVFVNIPSIEINFERPSKESVLSMVILIVIKISLSIITLLLLYLKISYA